MPLSMKPAPTLKLLLAVAFSVASVGAFACGSEKDKPPIEGSPHTNASAPIVVGTNEPLRIGASMVLTGPNEPAGAEDTNAIVTAITLWKRANGAEIKG